MKNELARELSLAEGKIQYDNSVKRVLANKRILAWILKYVTEEFAGMSVDEIKTCIGSDIDISEIGVLPGRTNRREMEKIRGEAQEDAVPGEGELSFDMFAIPMENKEIGEELNQMCNLSDYVEELGIQKGLERGLEQGLERGLEQGKERLLRLQIEKKLAKGLSLSEIAEALEEKEETIRKMIGAIKHTTK